MTIQRLIQCVGLNEEDTAHLRLLLRVSRTQLRDTWSWGAEARSDLVIVNPRRLIGESAMRRSMQREVACAQVLEANDPKPAGLFLRKPFRRDAFVTLLNKVSRGTLVAPEIDSWGHDLYELDLGRVDLSSLEADHPGVHSAHAHHGDGNERPTAASGDSIPDLSGLLTSERRDEKADDDSAGEDAAPMAVADDSIQQPHGSGPQTEGGVDASATGDNEESVDEDATYPLIYYLEKGMLGGPARIALPGAPSLVLDPDEQMFIGQASLRALEPYARQLLRYGDWQRLSMPDLRVLRRTSLAKPYIGLIWMDSFIHSEGLLARHVDPGGNFRLTKRLDLAQDYPRAYRVGIQMTVPRKLHEIARLSAVGLAEVFDVVNAYEAIGYVEWTKRGQ